jgi:hypothetical protein
MIDLTESELSFLRKLKKHSVPLALQGNLSLLHIDRLVPEYVVQWRHCGFHSHRRRTAAITNCRSG